MVSSIWKLITAKEKVILITIVSVLFLSTFGYINYQQKQIEDLSKQLSVSEIGRQYETLLHNMELDKAKRTITEQNIRIEEFRLNSIDYELVLHAHEKELIAKKVKAQSDIQAELDRDNSLENQMRIISVMLQEFSNEN